MREKGVYRIIDANLNRCREGLRVVEDIFRFLLADDILRCKVRALRHSLDKVPQASLRNRLLQARDSVDDPGKNADSLEMKRSNVADVFYINVQRAKESLRVLEEFLKLTDADCVKTIKKARYGLYTVEKKAHRKWTALRNFRS